MSRKLSRTVAGSLLLGLLTFGCTIQITSATIFVAPGGIATFVLQLARNTGPSITAEAQYVVAEVPLGWSHVSSSYTGTASGATMMIMGTGAQVADPLIAVCGLDTPPPAGFQRIFLRDSMNQDYALDNSDTATVTVDLMAGAGAGPQLISFRIIGSGSTPECAQDSVLVNPSITAIPTAHPYGLALMALIVLLVGVGAVGRLGSV